MLNIIRPAFKTEQVTQSGKDIIVKSRDRAASKSLLESYLNKKKIKFSETFKKSKSSSMNVITLDEYPGDIIFKPIIQKGAGGLKFEKELESDLVNYFNGIDLAQLKHQDVIKEMQSALNIVRKPGVKFKIIPEGSKNQKRQLIFNNNKILISNSTGETLTDLTMKYEGKTYYLSLKMSQSYYTLSASIFQYFLNTGTKVSINEYFGFDGQKMGGFGKDYICITKKPNYSKVKSNLQELMQQAYGSKVIIIHKKTQNNVMVADIKSLPKVMLSNITDNSYVYPEAGKRKYANIKTDGIINGHRYKINFQFRGTTATDVGPKYLRILMERL